MRAAQSLALYLVTSAPDEYGLVCVNVGAVAIVCLRWRISATLDLSEESLALGHSTGQAGPLRPGEVAVLLDHVGASADVWLTIEVRAALDSRAFMVDAYVSVTAVVTEEPSTIQALGRTGWQVPTREVR